MAKRIKSAVKRAEVAERNRARNVVVKSQVKTAVKKAVEAAKSNEAVAERVSEATSSLDRAVSKGVLHKNTVARKKSRMAKKVNALTGA